MTKDKNDAASLLGSVKDQQSTVRLYTERGGTPDWMAVFVAGGVGALVTHAGHPSTLALALRAVGVLVGVVVVARHMRRRRNLGGEVGIPTWIASVAVFIAEVAAAVTLHGDAREVARAVAMGVAVLGLGVVYRSAMLLMLGGVFALAAGASGNVPVLVWMTPIVLWIAVVGYFGREQLKRRLTV